MADGFGVSYLQTDPTGASKKKVATSEAQPVHLGQEGLPLLQGFALELIHLERPAFARWPGAELALNSLCLQLRGASPQPPLLGGPIEPLKLQD